MKMIPRPNSLLEVLEQPQHLRLDHHVERGGRLVGDEQARLAGEREPDQHALALAPRELVRIVARAPGRQPDQLEQLTDARRHLAAPVLRVQADRLADLIADTLHRVERVERALEDDREVGPAHGAQAPRLHLQHVLAVEQHLAGHLRALRQQPQQRRRHRGLAAARLARQPERLAGVEVEVDAAHRRHGRAARRVGHVQVAHPQEVLFGAQPRSFSRGSRISSSAVPISVNDSATSRIPSPGGTKYHQASCVIAPGLEGLVEHLAPGDVRRVAEAEERQRGLGEDHDRHGQRGVGEDQRRDVRQDVARHQVPVGGAERAAAVDVVALPERQHLRADHAAPSTATR